VRVGAGEAQADAKDTAFGVAGETAEQLVARARTGPACLGLADRRDRHLVDGGHLDEPDRRPHLRTGP